MATTSLRLPVDVITELKQEAKKRGIRYTAYLRAVLEQAAHPDATSELAEIKQRLARIEHALTDHHDDHPRKSA
ncbi:MAG: CopG family antitoxin [Sciscionella sp.]